MKREAVQERTQHLTASRPKRQRKHQSQHEEVELRQHPRLLSKIRRTAAYRNAEGAALVLGDLFTDLFLVLLEHHGLAIHARCWAVQLCSSSWSASTSPSSSLLEDSTSVRG